VPHPCRTGGTAAGNHGHTKPVTTRAADSHLAADPHLQCAGARVGRACGRHAVQSVESLIEGCVIALVRAVPRGSPPRPVADRAVVPLVPRPSSPADPARCPARPSLTEQRTQSAPVIGRLPRRSRRIWSGTPAPIQRSAIPFARSARTGVWMMRISAPLHTASKTGVNLLSRSRIKKEAPTGSATRMHATHVPLRLTGYRRPGKSVALGHVAADVPDSDHTAAADHRTLRSPTRRRLSRADPP
jgi:hypothetical protein